MLLKAEFLKTVFKKALTFPEYLATGTQEQQQRWQDVYKAIKLTDEQENLLAGFIREMKILVVSGIWCGDCVEQGPLIARIAQACPEIDLRFIDRDARPQLRNNITINSGNRVPVAIFMAEDFAPCAIYGDRTLTRYRALASRQLSPGQQGSGPACSTGLFVPDTLELAETLQDWLNEVERIQIMLRLSARLREIHQD